jgi:DNA repair protein RecO (recombination protein O)
MEWQDEGIALSVRPHGETDAILSALTFEHGRHLGLVKGGIGRRARPALQPGNRLELAWKARLADHLGNFTVEPIQLFGGRLQACSTTCWRNASRTHGSTRVC